MRSWIFEHWEHVLCGLLLFSRVADLGTTWLVTPSLKLEGNPIARRLGWRFGFLTLLACLLPYYRTDLAYAALIGFLLVAVNNARAIWLVRSLGEERYAALLREAVAHSSLGVTILWLLLPAGLYALIGGLFLLLSGGASDWAAWGAVGIFIHVVATSVYGTLFFRRLFRSTVRPPAS